VHWHAFIILWICLVCHGQVHAYLRRRRGWDHPEGWNDPNAPGPRAIRIRLAATLRLMGGNRSDDERAVLDLAADLLEESADG
jgi:hypothetical protein